jgi:hypothetical protein
MKDRVAELYALPLEEFTAARNELVRQLQDAGDKESAKEVRSLRKPTLAAWAVNQLARRHADELRELMDLRDRLSSGDASSLRAASTEQRKLVAVLTDHARKILEEGGHPSTPATLESVSKSLLAGGTEAERELILAGRLTRELAPSGFEGLLDGAAGMPEEEIGEVKVDAGAARRAEELSRDAQEAEREAARLEREAEAARREADSLERRAERARVKAEAARAKADEALDAL